MGWLGKLFGTDKALETGADVVKKVTGGVISGIDYAFHTDQEKAEESIKIAELNSKVLLALQDQFTPRSISRRILAFAFTFCFCSSFIISLTFACLDKTHVVNNVIGLVKAYDLGWIMITVVIFYFGNYLVDKLKKK